MKIKRFFFIVLGLLFAIGVFITKYIIPTEKIKKNTTSQSFTLQKSSIMNFASLQHDSHSSHSSHDSHGSHDSHDSHDSHASHDSGSMA